MSTKENQFVYADSSKCKGCKVCEIACIKAQAGCDYKTVIAQKMPVKAKITVVKLDGVKVPIQCRQCEDAPCAHVCPVGALRQEDGLVKLNRENCVGCKLCAMVCPFGSIVMTPDIDSPKVEGSRTNKAKALKCDLCYSLNGEVTAENCACIKACPTKALTLVDYEGYRQNLLASRVQGMINQEQ